MSAHITQTPRPVAGTMHHTRSESGRLVSYFVPAGSVEDTVGGGRCGGEQDQGVEFDDFRDIDDPGGAEYDDGGLGDLDAAEEEVYEDHTEYEEEEPPGTPGLEGVLGVCDPDQEEFPDDLYDDSVQEDVYNEEEDIEHTIEFDEMHDNFENYTIELDDLHEFYDNDELTIGDIECEDAMYGEYQDDYQDDFNDYSVDYYEDYDEDSYTPARNRSFVLPPPPGPHIIAPLPETVDPLCTLCYDHPADTILLPCRHLNYCGQCCDRLEIYESSDPRPKTGRCPLCRQIAVDRITVFRG